MGRNNCTSLLNAGLTNNGSEDYGTFVSSKNRIFYDYFCTSEKCCTVVTSEQIINVRVETIIDGKTTYTREPQLYKTFKILEKVLKKTSINHIGKCPDCGKLLFSKRSKKKMEFKDE